MIKKEKEVGKKESNESLNQNSGFPDSFVLFYDVILAFVNRNRPSVTIFSLDPIFENDFHLRFQRSILYFFLLPSLTFVT